MLSKTLDKIFAIIGLIVSIAIIITGVYFAVNTPDAYTTDHAQAAIFGADFYTEIHDATRIGANNTAVVANNIREHGQAMALYWGTLFIITGIFAGLYNTKKLLLIISDEKELAKIKPAYQTINSFELQEEQNNI